MQLTFELRNLAAYFDHHRVPLVKARVNIYLMTLNGQINVWNVVKVTWGHIMLTEVGHAAYQSVRRDKPGIVRPRPRF